MPFFSTAANSPQAGTATRGLRELTAQNEAKRQFDIKDERLMDQLIAKKTEEARMKTLSNSLLGLKKYDQENVTAWAVANSVSADELNALEPVMRQREQRTEFIDIDTPTETGQKNIATGQKFTTAKPGKVITKTEGGFVSQYDPITNKLLSRHEVTEPAKRVINKEDDNFIWQEDPTTGQVLNRVQKPKVAGTGAGGKVTKADKVEDWYLKTKAEIEKAYYGDNMEPTDVQRQNFDRAMLRAETSISEISSSLGIPKEMAVPYAMRLIRQEKVWGVNADASLPEVNRGVTAFTSSEGDTVQAIKDLRRTGTPDYIIGDALAQKGWTSDEVSELMILSTKLVPAKAAGFSAKKLADTRIAEGQSIKDKQGTLWTRKGKFLVSEDGRRVRK